MRLHGTIAGSRMGVDTVMIPTSLKIHETRTSMMSAKTKELMEAGRSDVVIPQVPEIAGRPGTVIPKVPKVAGRPKYLIDSPVIENKGLTPSVKTDSGEPTTETKILGLSVPMAALIIGIFLLMSTK